MGLFSWLFGSSSAGPSWTLTEKGNSTTIYKNRRLTVFPADGGWKFCDVNVEGDDDPDYSSPYESVEAAKHEVIAWLGGAKSRYQPLYTKSEERKKLNFETMVTERQALASEVREALQQQDVKVTALRKLEGKVATQVRHYDRVYLEAERVGLARSHLKQLKQTNETFEELAAILAARIEDLKTKAKGNKASDG